MRWLRFIFCCSVILLVSLSCNLPEFISDDEPVDIETAVASTLDAYAAGLTEEAHSGTQDPSSPDETQFPTTPPTITVPPSPTFTPPPEGLSLNCDGIYQRVRTMDAGAAGKTILVEDWDGTAWIEVWSLEGGDPMDQQIEEDAGPYLFGDCQYMIIVPIRFGGSGAVLELSIFAWDGSGMVEMYINDGVHGDWQKFGDIITFEESLYLFDEPNCCPCNRQYLEHSWDGSTFVQTGSLITPTYEGDPPDYCQP